MEDIDETDAENDLNLFLPNFLTLSFLQGDLISYVRLQEGHIIFTNKTK